MKKVILISLLIAYLSFIVTLNSCKKDERKQPSKTCDEEMAEIDPVYIYAALKDIYELESDTTLTDKDSVELIKERIDEKYNLLKAIRDLNSPQSDSIFNIFHAVHADYYYLQHIYFTLPDSSLYYSNIELQKIIKKYNLTLASLEVFNPPYTSVILKACPIINTYALKKEIEKTTNILNVRSYVLPNNIKAVYGWGYEHNKLEITEDPVDNSKLIRIYIGWGDCLAGCINNYNWEFKVFKDFSVKHIRSYGRL